VEELSKKIIEGDNKNE